MRLLKIRLLLYPNLGHDIAMSGYDFSQLYHSSILAYSPGTTFIATAHQNRIIVRSTTTLQIVRTWLCTPSTPVASSSKAAAEISIDILQWSEDGSYLLVMGKGTVWVFALAEEGSGASGEVAVIGEGLDGCVKAEWGKGSRDILVWSDHGVSVSQGDTGGAGDSYFLGQIDDLRPRDGSFTSGAVSQVTPCL